MLYSMLVDIRFFVMREKAVPSTATIEMVQLEIFPLTGWTVYRLGLVLHSSIA
jgi:hypothetical protein